MIVKVIVKLNFFFFARGVHVCPPVRVAVKWLSPSESSCQV